MKLNEAPQLNDGPYRWPTLVELLRQAAKKVNALASGSFSALENTATAAPTSGTWAQGDFIANSNRIEAGLVGSKYVVMGWTCLVSGTPGTWVQVRTLTGN